MDYIVILLMGVSFMYGASHMNSLMENPDVNINRLSFKYAVWGSIFGGLSLLNLGALSILFMFLMGMFFGLIGVNLIFERTINK